MINKVYFVVRELLSYFSDSEIRKIRRVKVSYLTPAALLNIKRTVKLVEANNVQGIFVEAGCALGGSAILIARNKTRERPFQVYDAFGMIPPPTDKDGEDVLNRYEEIKMGKSPGIGGNKYYGYEEDLYSKVLENFKRFGVDIKKENVNFIKGLFEDTLRLSEPVAFAHIDGDWYSSTMTCLEQIIPNLSKGGVMIVDDYNAWSGCRQAVDEYFKDKKDAFKFTMVAKKLSIQRV